MTNPIGKYEEIGQAIGRLVDEKQRAYGRSFDKAGEILRILYPDRIRPDQYDDVLAMVRILDKFFRIATNKTALGENPWQDIAGYGLLMNRQLLDVLERIKAKEEKAFFLSPFTDETAA